ncbi:MAG: ATP-binding protein [Chloroflexota bacterium]
MQGTAHVLGYLEGNAVRFPRHAATPGTGVTPAPDDLLRKFFSAVESGIEIGTLINRDRVPVMLNPNGLRRHLAVIAQTGAGKSYTVGVILEKLLQLGGTIVVFDPNSDYVLMRRDAKNNRTSFADRVEIYRLPTTQAGRITDEEIGSPKPKTFTMQFSKLDADELIAMSGVPDKASRIRLAINTVWENLQGRDYTAENFKAELETLADSVYSQDAEGGSRKRSLHPSIGDEKEFDREFKKRIVEKADVEWDDLGHNEPGEDTPKPKEEKSKSSKSLAFEASLGAQGALKYIHRLEGLGIWGFEDVPMEPLLRPMGLSVIDLAGIDQDIMQYVVDKVLRETWSVAVNQGLPRPIFFVLEEAHNFVPGDKSVSSQAARIIKRIASEGRKFGLFLVLITQRPYKVHQDTLSQCNSQIIMRLTNPQDQDAVTKASESMSEGLLADLPGLNIGEAVVLGPLVRVPVMVRVGARESKEGGNDIDVIAALERARSEVLTDVREQKSKEEKKARGRSEWKEAV